MHIHDIRCDYEHCNQMYNKETNGWWVVAINDENDTKEHGILIIFQMDEKELEDEGQDDWNKHACSIEHAIKIAAKRMEEVQHPIHVIERSEPISVVPPDLYIEEPRPPDYDESLMI